MDEVRTMLERYTVAMFQRAELAEMRGDVESWEYFSDAERDGRKALDMLASGQWTAEASLRSS